MTFSLPATSPGQVVGTATNDNAAAGDIGEFISATVLIGAAVVLTTGTPANVTSIFLAAGDWDVWGNVQTNPAGSTTTTFAYGAINTVPAAMPTAPAGGAFTVIGANAAGFNSGFTVGPTRLSLAASTTVYLVAEVGFSVSTMGAYGFLGARRRR